MNPGFYIHIYREVFRYVKQAVMASVLVAQNPKLSTHLLFHPTDPCYFGAFLSS